MAFSDTPLPIKIAFIVLLVAFLLHVIGLSTIEWVQSEGASSGLWKYYTDNRTCDISAASGELTVTRVFECLGFIGGIAFIAFTLISIYRETERSKILSVVSCIVIGVLILIGVVIYGTQKGMSNPMFHFGYSFVLTVVSGILYVVTGVLIQVLM